MANAVVLNNIDHGSLRIDTTRGAALGDGVMCAITYPAEFRNVQAEYPIVFQAVPGIGLRPLALFGFREGQNLFLVDDCWDASYLPHAIERQPFMIGESADGPMLLVDLDSPRLGRGELLFREHGGTTEFLERMNSVLSALHDGMQSTPSFVEALQAHDLLEPFVLDLQFVDGSHHRLAGFHAINEERLAKLDAGAFAELGVAGHLEPIYMALASLANFRFLIERQNRALAAP